MSWLEFAVEVDAEAVEPVSELLAQHGYNGGVVVDQPIIPGSDGPEYTYDTTRPVTVRTYLPADDQAEEARARIEQALWHLGRMRTVGPLRVTTVEEDDWANAWKQHYTIHRLGARTVIVPSWLEYEPQPDDLVLRLDPGMAFGTGLHPTTQLCIGFLERYVQPGDTVVDLGSGSGILSLVAALSGAARVLGLDTDPVAVDATRDNAARNGLSDRISAAEGSLGRGALLGHWLQGVPDSLPEAPADFSSADAPIPQCDLIVANIIAKVLVMLSADIVAALRPGGILISSGIIADREDEVALAYAAAGLTRLERVQQGDWVALVHQKNA